MSAAVRWKGRRLGRASLRHTARAPISEAAAPNSRIRHAAASHALWRAPKRAPGSAAGLIARAAAAGPSAGAHGGGPVEDDRLRVAGARPHPLIGRFAPSL